MSAPTEVGVRSVAVTRRRWGRVVAAVVTTLVLVAGIGWVAVTSLSTPLGPGSFGGSDPATVKVITDGIRDTGYLVTAPTGGTGLMKSSLHNNGPFPIRASVRRRTSC